MATTTNYGWNTPDDTDLVKDGASAIRTLGSSIDTTTKNLNPQTTTGAIAYRSATSNVNTSLPIGTAGQVLTVNSGATAPEWANAGGMTLISTTTLNGTPSIVLSNIPQTYRHLYIVIRQFLPATDGAVLQMRFNNDSNANRHTRVATSSANMDGGTDSGWNSASVSIAGEADNASSQNLTFVEIFDYTNSTTWKLGRSWAVTNNKTTNTNPTVAGALLTYNQTSAITSLGFLPSTGNMTSGTLLLYGVL